MKTIFSILTLLTSLNFFAQDADPATEFWNTLQQYCGRAFEGYVVEAPQDDAFRGKKLIMHVRSCEEKLIKIPFLVGEDRSRTWIFSKENERIQLKHDHRHEDGTKDEVTMYGGTATNYGLSDIQVFPADPETALLLPLAATNVWWVTLNDNTLTYNLRRIGTDRFFSIAFDLRKPVPAPAAPWGWED